MKPGNACCSFCCNSYIRVGPFVEGPKDVYICRDCVELCQSILDEERRRRNPRVPPHGAGEVCARLDQFVSGQHEAKRALAQAAGARLEGGGRVLLIGPCCSDQLFLARALAHVLDAPFVAGDTSSVIAGEQGLMQVTLLADLLEASGFDLDKAQHGIVYVDGAQRPETQAALVQLWQGKLDRPDGPQVATGRILFVCGGTFAGLDETIVRRGRHPEQPVTVDDLRAIGVLPDWAHCLIAVASVAPLDEASLMRLVRSVDLKGCGIGTHSE